MSDPTTAAPGDQEDPRDALDRARIARRAMRRALLEPVPFRFLPGIDHLGTVRCWRERGEFGSVARFTIPQTLVLHSPTGMEWGYRGSGPADFAINLLALVVPPYWAQRYSQRFKEDCVARIPEAGATITVGDIVRWVEVVHTGRGDTTPWEFAPQA